MSTNDYYEEQARTNGAICDHSEEDKMQFLEKLAENGVINLEMEANFLSAMCTKLKVRHGIICMTLNNRLLGDKTVTSQQQIRDCGRKLFPILAGIVKETFEQSNDAENQ